MNFRALLPLSAVAVGLLTACGGSGDPGSGPLAAGNGQITDPATVASSTPVSPEMTYLIRDNGVSAPSGVSTTIAGGNTPTGGNARVYVIEPGDLCSTIADEMEVSVDEMLDSNPGTDCSVLIPGTELRVPAGGTGGSTPTPTPGATTPGAETTPTPGGGGGEYEIQPGDICVDIAASHGVDVDDLIAANNLDCGNLTVGDTITIP